MKRDIIIYTIFICCFFSLFCISCQSRKGYDTTTAFMEKLNDLALIDSLDDQVVNYGDTLAYGELRSIHYMAQERSSGFLFYALIMSNKYNYDQASYDVYYILTQGDKALDSTSKEMANYYLKKSKLSGRDPR